MPGRVIQGFFVGGQARPLPGAQARALMQRQAAALPPRAGPPAPAFAANRASIQARGGDGGFAVDPVQLGLARGGGQALPGALLAKMEAAFGADFSAVRVHVGAQAARIGAVAFTTGNDLYFAPGRYQPDSVQGQQLIGHELAHVIQQRQGRVRTPAVGIAVVQDRMLEAEADRLGTRAAHFQAPAPARAGVVQRAAAPGRPRMPARPAAMVGRGRIVQRCMEMEQTGTLDYNGDLIGMDLNDVDVQALLVDLKNNHGYSTQMIKAVEDIIEAAPVFVFDNPKHLKNYITNPTLYPPQLGFDDDAAEFLDDRAVDFGSAFKGPKIAFSGSRVYAVGYSEKATSLWAMLNSATGHIGKKEQNVVATWQPPPIPYSFPSNTIKALSSANLKRPSVMASNAHAEVNEIVQHAVRSLAEIGAHPHNVGLMFGSDIAHCAECYWAAHAMFRKAGKTPYNYTGCENRLFARWREPWDGFYKDYGTNPFRQGNGSFRVGFSVGQHSATKLNAQVSGTVGNIYK